METLTFLASAGVECLPVRDEAREGCCILYRFMASSCTDFWHHERSDGTIGCSRALAFVKHFLANHKGFEGDFPAARALLLHKRDVLRSLLHSAAFPVFPNL
jgi:hypothetical protein